MTTASDALNVNKPVSEDWTYFNEAVERRAKTIAGQELPIREELVTPEPPAPEPNGVSEPPPPIVYPPTPPINYTALWWMAGLLGLVSVAIIAAAIYLRQEVGPMGPPGPVGPTGSPGPQGPAASGKDEIVINQNPTAPVAPIPTLPTDAPREPKKPPMESVTRFFEVKMDGYVVVAGWNYKNSAEDSPYFQYCYALFPGPGLQTLRIPLANTKTGYLPYHQEDMKPLTREEYRKSVPQCTWAPGSEPR